MRTDKELMQLMLDNLDENFISGLCSLICILRCRLIISFEEAERIRDLINLHLPEKKYGLFSWYCWPMKEKQPRIEFLKNLLNKLQ